MTTKVKWRISTGEPFRYYSEVPNEMLRRYIGPITPYGGPIKFKIVDEIPQIIQQYFGRTHEIILLNMTECFYLIEGNLLLVYSKDAPVAMLRQENITHFKMPNYDWQPISNAVYYDQYCIVSHEPKCFAVVGSADTNLTFTDESDIFLSSLQSKTLQQLQEDFAIHNMIFT